MMYINGQAVAPVNNPVGSKTKPNLLNPENAHLGEYYFIFNGTYSEISSTSRFCYGKIPLVVGKIYEVLPVPAFTYAILLTSDDNKWRLDSGWIQGRFIFVATEPYLVIQIQIPSGSDFSRYKDDFIIQECDYEYEEIQLDLDSSKWEHFGIQYSYGRSFTEAKAQGASNQFRFNYLIPALKEPLLVINQSRYTIAIQEYDEDELGRMDSGWAESFVWWCHLWYPNFSISGIASTSVSVETILEALKDLHIYRIVGVKE